MSEPEQSNNLSGISKVEYKFFVPPPPVGFWIIGGQMGLTVGIYKRPTDQQIKNTIEMFGWEWKEA